MRVRDENAYRSAEFFRNLFERRLFTCLQPFQQVRGSRPRRAERLAMFDVDLVVAAAFAEFCQYCSLLGLQAAYVGRQIIVKHELSDSRCKYALARRNFG